MLTSRPELTEAVLPIYLEQMTSKRPQWTFPSLMKAFIAILEQEKVLLNLWTHCSRRDITRYRVSELVVDEILVGDACAVNEGCYVVKEYPAAGGHPHIVVMGILDIDSGSSRAFQVPVFPMYR
jgi:hypothetical protein